jgi:arylsulfatase
MVRLELWPGVRGLVVALSPAARRLGDGVIWLRVRLWVWLLVGGATLACADRSEQPRPSLLILVTVDTLRADRLGAYGGELELTPNLDAFAAQSLVFTSAYASSSFTVPSVTSIMTGRYPEEFAIWKNESGLPDSASTLAGELRNRGFRTAAVVSNFVLRKASGLASGFDRYDDALSQREQVRKWPERVAARTTDAGLATLDACASGAGSKCFVWIHYQDPHGPYTPPGSRRARYLRLESQRPDGQRLLPVEPGPTGVGGIPSYQFLDDQRRVAFYRAGYDAEVNYMDEEVGRLLRGVEERGLKERTAIAFAADHGESLGEGDYWFAHGEHLSEELVRVPLILRIPGQTPARREDVVSLVDLYDTLLRAMTGESGELGHRGRDLLAKDAPSQASVPYMATLGASTVPRYGLVDGDYKWIVSVGGDEPVGRLYRRGDDEVEIAAEHPELARTMMERLRRVRDGLGPGVPAVRQELTDADREALRALGYAPDPAPPKQTNPQ